MGGEKGVGWAGGKKCKWCGGDSAPVVWHSLELAEAEEGALDSGRLLSQGLAM